ncbi:rhodanese-like domain-containing protein [Pontiella sp.]|uniref:rhodanese-like domain-containing protein n=1 Tax=Pontiella sp. TaxID=2837462 RepID=UPI003569C2F0
MLHTILKMVLAFGVGILAINLLFGGRGDKKANLPGLVKDGALIVDTRTPGEFSNGHVQGAINIPYDIITGEIARHQPDPARPIIVYCRSGNRSSQAKRSLMAAGYTNVVNAGSIGNMQRNMPK